MTSPSSGVLKSIFLATFAIKLGTVGFFLPLGLEDRNLSHIPLRIQAQANMQVAFLLLTVHQLLA